MPSPRFEKKAPPPRPDWIRVKAPVSKDYKETRELIREHKLNTVCEEAACPNIGECWEKKHATVMILGSTCTRACTFCNIATGRPDLLDPHEPERVALAMSKLGLNHVVVTSVDRDDLPDGGADHFARTIAQIRLHSPRHHQSRYLHLTFRRKTERRRLCTKRARMSSTTTWRPLPRLYSEVRPGAKYFHSLKILANCKEKAPHIFTKSGIMVGLGETKTEIYQVMDDLRAAEVDFITIGQYLQPTPDHHPIERFITPAEFEEYAQMARGKGFLMVASSALTRSSYHAGDDFVKLRAAREEKLKAEG